MYSPYIEGITKNIPIVGSDYSVIPESMQKRIVNCARSMNPLAIYICDGTKFEWDYICGLSEVDTMLALKGNDINKMLPNIRSEYYKKVEKGEVKSYAIRGNRRPTYIPLYHEQKTLTNPSEAKTVKKELLEKFMNCMHGRYMWVLPYSVGAFGNSSSLLGIQLTDSPAVPLLMHRELKVSSAIWDLFTDKSDSYTFGVHSIGWPRPVFKKLDVGSEYLAQKEEAFVIHDYEEKEMWSFGNIAMDSIIKTKF